jgi:hypothetical protein
VFQSPLERRRDKARKREQVTESAVTAGSS